VGLKSNEKKPVDVTPVPEDDGVKPEGLKSSSGKKSQAP